MKFYFRVGKAQRNKIKAIDNIQIFYLKIRLWTILCEFLLSFWCYLYFIINIVNYYNSYLLYSFIVYSLLHCKGCWVIIYLHKYWNMSDTFPVTVQNTFVIVWIKMSTQTHVFKYLVFSCWSCLVRLRSMALLDQVCHWRWVLGV